MEYQSKKYEAENLDMLKMQVGQEIALSDWIQITQEQILQFAKATGDDQWIHVDEDRSQKESPFGKTIAHGYLLLALLPKIMRECILIKNTHFSLNCGLNRARFRHPVRQADQVRARFVLHSFMKLPDGAQLIFQVDMEVKGMETPACTAEIVSRHFL